MKSLLVGERFNRSPPPGPDFFTPHSAKWMERQLRMGSLWNQPRLLEVGVRWDASVNLTTMDTQGVPWNKQQAKDTAGEVVTRLMGEHRAAPWESSWDFRHVWMVGRRVQDAFGFLRRPEPYYTVEWNGIRWTGIPHPSGLCRFWNDEDEVGRLREFVASLGKVHEVQEVRRCVANRSRG